jgi:uncharacterized SAM-binding protein YcdF (DUF218 family)
MVDDAAFLPPSTVPADRSAKSGRAFTIAVGAMLAMLAGFLISELGGRDILGNISLETTLLTSAAIGAVIAFAGRVRLVLLIDVILIGVYLFIIDTPIMSPPAAAWVRADSLPARADAIVVLSSTVNSAGMVDEQGVGRLLSGLELFQRGIAPVIITSEVSAEFGDVRRSSTADVERLVTLAGARTAWTFVTDVHSTRDEATRVAAKLGRGKSIVLVTQPMHTRRACATFEAVGLKVFCAPSREQRYVAWHPRNSGERLEAFREYVYERLGMVKYRAKGWVSP